MKFSDSTVDIFKNLSALNMGIVISEDQKPIYCKKSTHEVLVEWIPVESFPFRFTIDNLSDFLSTYSMFKESDLKFHEDYMVISFGNSHIKYGYAHEMVVDTPSDEDIEFVKEISDDLELSFELSNETLSNLHKASSVMKLDTVNFTADGKELIVELYDSENVTNNRFTVNLGENSFNFDITMPTERLKSVIDATYQVYVGESLLKMYNETLQLTYWVSLD